MKKLFVLIFLVLGIFLFPQTTLADCRPFNLPQFVTAGETFIVDIQNVQSGLFYTLSYRRGAIAKNFVNTRDSPKTATGNVISFSPSLEIAGAYEFRLQGRDSRGDVVDICISLNNVEVVNPTPKPGESPTPRPIPWRLTGSYECVQDRGQGTFATKEECETQAALQRPTPTPPPLPLNCVEGIDAQGKITNDRKLMVKCTKIDTAFGAFDIEPAGFIKKIFSILLGFAGAVAVLLIILSGYRFMTSQGNPEKVQEAREQLTSAVVGLLFIIFSIAILTIIGVDILRIPGFAP